MTNSTIKVILDELDSAVTAVERDYTTHLSSKPNGDAGLTVLASPSLQPPSHKPPLPSQAALDESNPVVSRLCAVIEVVLEHRLARPTGLLAASAPAPTLWDLVSQTGTALPGAESWINALTTGAPGQVLRTRQAKGRGWIRAVLNDRCCALWIKALAFDATACSALYEPDALMRLPDASTACTTILARLTAIPFALKVDDPELMKTVVWNEWKSRIEAKTSASSSSGASSASSTSSSGSTTTANNANQMSLDHLSPSFQPPPPGALPTVRTMHAALQADMSRSVTDLLAEASPETPMMESEPTLDRFCVALENIMQYALKQPTFWGTTTWWELIKLLPKISPSAKPTIDFIKTVPDINTALARSRAFVRFALNEGTLHAHLISLCTSKAATTPLYDSHALLRRPNHVSSLLGMVAPVTDIKFALRIDDESLNNKDKWAHINALFSSNSSPSQSTPHPDSQVRPAIVTVKPLSLHSVSSPLVSPVAKPPSPALVHSNHSSVSPTPIPSPSPPPVTSPSNAQRALDSLGQTWESDPLGLNAQPLAHRGPDEDEDEDEEDIIATPLVISRPSSVPPSMPDTSMESSLSANVSLPNSAPNSIPPSPTGQQSANPPLPAPSLLDTSTTSSFPELSPDPSPRTPADPYSAMEVHRGPDGSIRASLRSNPLSRQR